MAAEASEFDDEVKADAVHLSLTGLSGAPKEDAPVWKERYFVINGGFLFRFVHENHTKPKGRPISLADVTVRRADEGDGRSLQIVSLSKNHILRAATTAIRDEWVTELRRAKQHAIKVSMGHAPVTRGELEAHKVGDEIVRRKTKQREDARKMEQQLLKEVQYSSAAPW